jgi:hypothetical protein
VSTTADPRIKYSAHREESTVKHAPATPLPWVPEIDLEARMYHVVSPGQECLATGWEADMKYIAHACTSYPKLIAALRRIRQNEGALSFGHALNTIAEMKVVAETLLVELGERP